MCTTPRYKINTRVIEHFLNPKNKGKMSSASSIGSAKFAKIIIKVYIKVIGKEISKIKFQASHCVTLIASASALTELAKGMKIAEAINLSKDDISKLLGEIPKEKIHCCEIVIKALHDAISNYFRGDKE
jgi:NifU-like protein involved in Fe-S cluster formation